MNPRKRMASALAVSLAAHALACACVWYMAQQSGLEAILFAFAPGRSASAVAWVTVSNAGSPEPLTEPPAVLSAPPPEPLPEPPPVPPDPLPEPPPESTAPRIVSPAAPEQPSPRDSQPTNAPEPAAAGGGALPDGTGTPIFAAPDAGVADALGSDMDVHPVYPVSSRLRGEQGEVEVVFRLDEQRTRVVHAEVVRSSGYPALDAAALQALRRARFVRRRLLAANPGPESYRITVRFVLTD